MAFDEHDLKDVKNIGEKAVAEIAELLEREGLRFGMTFEEVDGELRVVKGGSTPPEAAEAAGENG